MKRLITTTALLGGLLSFAAPQITPQGIIVNPNPTDLSVQTWVDRDPSGYGNSTYYFGDNIAISVQVNQSAYVYLFNVNANGNIDLILPNQLNADNYLQGGEVRQFPQSGSRYQFNVTGPSGVDQVLAVASRQPLSLNQIADIRSGQVMVQGANNLARALSIVVNPLPANDWVSDAVRYNVQPKVAVVPNPQPQPVTLTPAPRSWFSSIAPYPNKQIMWQSDHRNESAIAYRYNDKYDVEHIFSYYHKTLLSMGWVKTRFQGRGAAYHAEYSRGRERAVVDVIPHDGQVEYRVAWGN